MFRHLFDQALREQFLQSTASKGASDLQPFRHNRRSDQPVAGDFFVQLIICGFVKEDQVVQFVPDFSLGPLLQVSKKTNC